MIRTGYRSALIDGRTYDTVIVATGYRPEPLPGLDRDLLVLDLDCRQDEKGTYVVGPAANLPFDTTEDDRIGENRVGLFRLAPRTARLASRLD